VSNARQRSEGTAVNSLARIGVVAEFTIGASDVNCLLDPDDATKTLGPLRDVLVLAGAGSLVYVDDENGTVHTLTSLSSASDPLTDMAIRTIHGTGNGSPSAAFTIRGRW
jgi:hypothetical protein